MLSIQVQSAAMSSPERVAISDEGYCKSFLLGLFNMQKQSRLTDVTLRVQDITVSCHRVVLCAATPYFHTMFNSDLKESSSSEVELKGLEGSTLQQLVKYMYTAKIELHGGNVQRLAQACDLLHLSQLKEHCEAFMMSQVTPANCLGFHRFGNLYSLKQLAQTALLCMQENFHEVVISHNELVALTQGELVTYISDDHLNVPNENMVVEAVLEWVRADLKTRTEAVRHVAEHLRFSFCTKAYLCYQLIPEPLLSVCQVFLQEANDHHLMQGQLQVMPRHLPRIAFKTDRKLVLLGGIMHPDWNNRRVWVHSHEQQEPWHDLCTLPQNFRLYSACVTPEGIVITGGVNGKSGNTLAECWIYDSRTKWWNVMPSISVARHKHRAAYHDGDVFVVGGVNVEDIVLASVERLDLKHRQWQEASPMLLQLHSLLAVSFRSKLLIFSGRNPQNETSRCTQEFDPVWNRWVFRADMPEVCDVGDAVCIGNVVYVVGGFSRSCMSYQPMTDTWCVLTGPSQEHGNAPAVVWKGKILVGGGNDDDKNETSIIEEFDPKQCEWSVWSESLAERLTCHFMLDVDF